MLDHIYWAGIFSSYEVFAADTRPSSICFKLCAIIIRPSAIVVFIRHGEELRGS